MNGGKRPHARNALFESLNALTELNTGAAQLLRLERNQLEEDPDNVRRSFDETGLDELATTIADVGVLTPLIVLPPTAGRPLYRIVDGHRRFRAAERVSVNTFTVVVVSAIADVPRVQLILNLQREDVSAVETARALQGLMEAHGIDRQDQVAELLGKSKTWVSRHLGLLSLPDDIKQLAESGKVRSYTRLIELAKQPVEVIASVADAIDAGQGYESALTSAVAAHRDAALSRGAAANGAPGADDSEPTDVDNPGQAKPRARGPGVPVDADIAALERRVAEAVAAEVSIKHGAKGRGTFAIKYANLEVLHGILEKLGVDIDA